MEEWLTAMKCPQCKFENPANVRFCNKCGNKMEMICPVCSKLNPPESSFCGECGYDLLKTPADNSQPMKLPLSQLLRIKSASMSQSCSVTSPDTQP